MATRRLFWNSFLSAVYLTICAHSLLLVTRAADVTLGASCRPQLDACTSHNSECSNGTCKCIEGYELHNSACSKGMGKTCTVQRDCMFSQHSFCAESMTCQCFDGYIFYEEQCLADLGSSCNTSSECLHPNVRCNSTNQCACDINYDNVRGVCKSTSDLSCYIDEDCHGRFANSYCGSNMTCECSEGHFLYDGSCIISPLGSSCTTDIDCSPIAFSTCNSSSQCTCSNSSVNVGGICKGMPAAPCVDDSLCLQYSSCKSSVCTCDSHTIEEGGICRPIIGINCTKNTDCTHRLFYTECNSSGQCSCHPNYIGDNLQCKGKIGAFCFTNSECFDTYSYCTTNLTCQCISDRQKNGECLWTVLGSSCNQTADCSLTEYSHCNSSNLCSCNSDYVSVDGLCRGLAGAICTTDDQCYSDYSTCNSSGVCICDVNNTLAERGICKAKLGSTCSATECYDGFAHCKYNLTCQCIENYVYADGRCRAKPGQSCFSDKQDSDCLGATFGYNVTCTAGTCICSTGFYSDGFLCRLEGCPAAVTSDLKGEVSWPYSAANDVAVELCPQQLTASKLYASRTCKVNSTGTAYWDQPDTSSCPFESQLSNTLKVLSETNVTKDNVNEVSANLSVLSSRWSVYQSQDVYLTLDVVEAILEVTKDEENMRSSFEVANNMLNIDVVVLTEGEQDHNTSSRLVAIVDKILSNVNITDAAFAVVQDNIAGFASKLDPTEFNGFSLSAETRLGEKLDDRKIHLSNESKQIESSLTSIVIPKSVLNLLTEEEKETISRITLAVYRSATVFDTVLKPTTISEDMNRPNRTRSINSYVLAASIPGVIIRNLSEPIVISFVHLAKTADNPTCVYWDIFGGTGNWSENGCNLNKTDENQTICHCHHMTNFALLMDVYGSSGRLDEEHRKILSYISYIGCGISLLCLILTLISYSSMRKVRQSNPSKILMNLCTVLALSNFVFLAGMQGYTINSNDGCKVVAVMLHFCLLSAMCWMAVEAFYMYIALVRIFNTYISHLFIKTSVFAYGVPVVIVIVTLAVKKTENYGLQPGDICWMAPIPFYAAFLTPVCLILLVNIIVFILVLRQLLRKSKRLAQSKTNKSDTATRLRAAVSIVILLGLTWLFGILTIDGIGIVFTYLFTIFNSLQGLFIFIFYCFLKNDVSNSWKRRCCPRQDETSTRSNLFTSQGSKGNVYADKNMMTTES